MKNKNDFLASIKSDYDERIVKVNKEIIKNLDLDIQKVSGTGICINFPTLVSSDEDMIKYLLVLNSINFQFWEMKDNEFVRYGVSSGLQGSLAMHNNFRFFWEEMFLRYFNPTKINEDLIVKCFENIPNIPARVENLQEMFSSDKLCVAADVVRRAAKSGNLGFNEIQVLSGLFPKSFKEPYFKKIQLALQEIISLVYGDEISADLTVFADYQLPKVLEGLGIISYSDELSNSIANAELILQDSTEERAIRAATIFSCEEIVKEFNVSFGAVDKFLWSNKENELFKNKKFHLTKTTRY